MLHFLGVITTGCCIYWCNHGNTRCHFSAAMVSLSTSHHRLLVMTKVKRIFTEFRDLSQSFHRIIGISWSERIIAWTTDVFSDTLSRFICESVDGYIQPMAAPRPVVFHESIVGMLVAIRHTLFAAISHIFLLHNYI